MDRRSRTPGPVAKPVRSRRQPAAMSDGCALPAGPIHHDRSCPGLGWPPSRHRLSTRDRAHRIQRGGPSGQVSHGKVRLPSHRTTSRHRPPCSAHRSAAGPPPCARPTRRPAAPTIDPAAAHPEFGAYREDGKKQAVCLSARCLTAGAVGTWRAGSSHARDHGERASRAN